MLFRRGLAIALSTSVAALSLSRAIASPSDGDGPDIRPKHPAAIPAKRGASPIRFERPAITRGGIADAGILRGKTVYVSAGHGWNYTSGAWRTQRGNTHDIVEDFVTAEGVDQFLIPMLHAMGAYVVPIRESDLASEGVVVDDGDATISGSVSEGASAAGWGPMPVPFTSPDNPFALGTSRTMTASATETGRAEYAVDVATSGYYNVYVSYVQGTDRAPDAHVIVRHAGGESHLRIDQRRHGGTWVLLGRWYFDAGAPAEFSSIAFANDSATAGSIISFDAVRVGAGMAPHAVGGATTGRPMFESAARFSTQLLGAPPSVWEFSTDPQSADVVSRPRFAAWEHEDGEDAVYVAWHTNAPSPSRGTMSIAFGNTFPCCSPLTDFAGTPGSLELLSAVHDEVVSDLRVAWDPTWRDAGKVTAALGELRPTHNGEMPAILVEVAYHDTALDADSIREPRFQMLAARAISQGIAKYFARKDGRTVVLPPDPPIAVRVENTGNRTLRVSWRPPESDSTAGDAPTSYVVQVSEHGYGYDDGTEVTGETFELRDLPGGAVRYVRVVARNAGGDSMPTEIVAARVASSGTAPILVVGGFDRLDAGQNIRDEAPLVGTVDRSWVERMNNGTYAVRHASALAAAGFAFDGATDEAVEERDVDLTRYQALDWFTGEDTADQDPLTAGSRAELERFFLGGGNLLVSGSQLVSALDASFAMTQLRTSLAGTDAATYDVTSSDPAFAAVGAFSFRDSGPLGYDAEGADVLAPSGDATPVLTYASGGTAGVAWTDGAAMSRGLVVAFPIEMIADDNARRELLAAAMTSFGIAPDEGEDAGGGGCGCATSRTDDVTPLLWLAVGLFVLRRSRRK